MICIGLKLLSVFFLALAFVLHWLYGQFQVISLEIISTDMRAKMEISDNITKNPEVMERFKAMLKKAIDDHSEVEILEVGFRRGVEWYVFESGFHIAKELIEQNFQLQKENADLREALQRQVKE